MRNKRSLFKNILTNYSYITRGRGRGRKRRLVVEEDAEEGVEEPEVTVEAGTKTKKKEMKLTRLYTDRDNALTTDWKFHPSVPVRYLSVAGYIFPPPKSDACSGVKVILGNDEITQKTAETVEGQMTYEYEASIFKLK